MRTWAGMAAFICQKQPAAECVKCCCEGSWVGQLHLSIWIGVNVRCTAVEDGMSVLCLVVHLEGNVLGRFRSSTTNPARCSANNHSTRRITCTVAARLQSVPH